MQSDGGQLKEYSVAYSLTGHVVFQELSTTNPVRPIGYEYHIGPFYSIIMHYHWLNPHIIASESSAKLEDPLEGSEEILRSFIKTAGYLEFCTGPKRNPVSILSTIRT